MKTLDVTTNMDLLKGGGFLFGEITAQDIFTPEDFTEEQKMIAETVEQFVEREIEPNWSKLENLEEGLNKELLRKMGDLGLLSTHMPEALGGLELDFISNSLIAEKIGPTGGFSVSYNAHTGIGMLPILYYGTNSQKEKYLPELMSGQRIACYCLTEPGSGSDALAAKTHAKLSEDGTHYILNGQKMWISNAGFADIFIVFAQVDGKHFTAFILERYMEGLTLGEEEKKMGIKSSSTRQVFLDNVRVPGENTLGDVGKGHLIAFNVLNTGRYKLGVSCLGGIKKISDSSIRYANERHQFGSPISSFGAMKHKLAQQAVLAFVTESVIYRLAGAVQDWIMKRKAEGMEFGLSKQEAAREYALECSIIKILGSEVLDDCVDEAVQIHGGIGYSEESKIAQAYRDSRINRIFEGTNEINRMLIVSIILKKALKGEMDIATPAFNVQSELMNGEVNESTPESEYPIEKQAIRNLKKILFLVLGSAVEKSMQGELNLKTEQEILMNIADMIIDIYSAESCLLRIAKGALRDKPFDDIYHRVLKTYINDVQMRFQRHATDAVVSFIKPQKLDDYVESIRKFCTYPLQNTKDHRRRIAEKLISENTYCL